MTFGLYGLPGHRTPQPAAPAPNPAGLPSRVVKAPRYTGDVAKHPFGPAAVVYDGGEQTHTEPLIFGNDDYPLEVIGSADQYRLLHRPEWSGAIPGSPLFLLSPNGRYSLVEDGSISPVWASELADLSTGAITTVPAGVPLAWSPDSRFAVFASFEVGGGIAATLQVAEMPSGTVILRAPIAQREGYHGNLSAAASPDGTAVAVLDGSELHVYRLTGTQWHSTLDTTNADWTTQRLAGPAAWMPDGTDVVLLDSTTGSSLGWTQRLVTSPAVRNCRWPAGNRRTAAPARG